MNNIALFGGTFDPIHLGHLAVATQIQAIFHFNRFQFLPCREPTHKPHNTSSTDRVNMIQLALETHPIEHASICMDEMNRTTPSYTIDTLTQIRAHDKAIPIIFILGLDMFHTLPTWHRYQDLLTYCHLLVLQRPTNTLMPHEAQALLDAYQTQDPNTLQTAPHGSILLFDAGMYDTSSRMIRRMMMKKESIEAWVPQSVLRYIEVHGLYGYDHEGNPSLRTK